MIKYCVMNFYITETKLLCLIFLCVMTILLGCIFYKYLDYKIKIPTLIKIIILLLYCMIIILITLCRESKEDVKIVMRPLFAFYCYPNVLTWPYEIIKNGFANIRCIIRHRTLLLDVLNILLFVPFGFILQDSQKETKWYTTAIIGFAFSAIIESIQLVFKLGNFEIDDVIFNSIGTMIGVFIVKHIFLKNIKI